MDEKCSSYHVRTFFLIIVVVICRYIYSINESDFYDYISYIFSIGLLLIILFPNLHEFSFWGIKAKGKIFPGYSEVTTISDKVEAPTGDSKHE